MERLSARCSWAEEQLLAEPSLLSSLPSELVGAIRYSTGSRFLCDIATAGQFPQCTDRILVLYQPLIPEIAARWLDLNVHAPFAENLISFSSLVRILPFAPYLRWHIKTLLSQSSELSKLKGTGLQLHYFPEDQLQDLLIAFFRLFTFDLDAFADCLHPALLPPLLSHDSTPVRYLAIEILCQLMRFADAFSQRLVERHVGKEAIKGDWEGYEIDYRLLKLFEEKRWQRLRRDLKSAEAEFDSFITPLAPPRFNLSDLSPHTAALAEILLPRHNVLSLTPSKFVQTPTATLNLSRLARALSKTGPILLTGPPGSGKTSLIIEAATVLNKLSSMVTLQLNEQTDAKSLLGIHMTSPSGGSFIWQAGVLTRAMKEGRWVLVEDIDKASPEVMGVLRTIIENGYLFIQSRKEHVKPAEGFRILATTGSPPSGGNHKSRHGGSLANRRLWRTVQVNPLDEEEVATLISSKFLECGRLVESMMTVHQAVSNKYHETGGLKSLQTRPPSLRDLLKWARRIVTRLTDSPTESTTGAIQESTKIDIFNDAVDCYAAYISSDLARMRVASGIAQKMQISPQQMSHVLKDRLPNFSKTSTTTAIGRGKFTMSTPSNRKLASGSNSPFALTRQARNSLETIASATSLSEPVLLVGETGVGKTTLVQHLATAIDQKLTVVNLSQQSEATDLLGGLKPVTLRSMTVPLLDEFSVLFDDTFSTKRNEKFYSALRKSVKQENWHRLTLLWQEAVQMAEGALQVPADDGRGSQTAPQSKRRKLATPKYQHLRERWTKFAANLETLKVQSARGESKLAFAFVEGRLVQAVRNGEWVLLDEINLASPETLDHIVSLLQDSDNGRPFLQLADSGNMERIIAHPNFRVFAAMNPANDTGKRELAPGIRSRFTEIFVHPGDDNIGDLVDLIQTYLGPMLSADDHAATDLAHAYLAINKLNQENSLTDGAGDLPHFTLRSLVRCLQYVNTHASTFGLRRSMCEGFAMSFFTALSKQSEILVQPVLYSHVLSGIRNIRGFLAQLPKTQLDQGQSIAFKHHRISRGHLPSQEQPHYIITPSVERNLLNLARATSMQRYPILLQGPTSSGKTSMVEYLAKLTGNKFVRVNNHEHTDLQEYLGSYASSTDGKLQYEDGVLVDALRNGHWIVLDELNLAPSDILEALNRLLDDNRELLVPESQEIVRPHPNFMLFATQNPAGLYGGRKRLSRAFRNRFLELHFDDIPEDELEVILKERSQIPPSFCSQIVAVYKKLTLQRQSARLFEQRNSFATLRDLFRWAARPADDRQQLALNGFMLLAERVRDSGERQIVKATIEEVFRFKLDENTVYGLAAIPGPLQHSYEVVWTPAMRRLFVLVSTALKNNEPVLLIGETGCGKTQICQVVAAAMGKKLNTYNAHTNTETGDLIGSLRPARNRAELANGLIQNLSKIFGPLVDGLPTEQIPIDALLERFNSMNISSQFDNEFVSQLRAAASAYNSLFQWVDGNLVQAMKAGEHFLLDEISLAEDSVLERLNSALEPSRTILLAEKGTVDNFVVASSGFQFIATMNPGGDYGKRELSAALRNRLTEIWVPPLTKNEDILPILELRLGEAHEYAAKMLQFAEWFRDRFQNSQTTPLPLRTLLKWVEFMRSCNIGFDPSFVHGAGTVYIDSLGANPAGLTALAMTDIDASRMVCLQKLDTIQPSFRASEMYSAPLQLFISRERERERIDIGSFSLRCKTAPSQELELFIQAPTTVKNTMRIMRALQMSKPLLLEGNPGVGKTAIVTALAKAVGKELFRINLSEQTDLMDLFGADVPSEKESIGTFTWRDGPLLQAMQSGSWVLLDEMNLASQSVLEGLNSCLDHRQEVYIADLDRTFVCHPEFRLFAAQNPHHQGGGRKGLPSSFVNRFTVVYADGFRKEDLEIICRSKFPELSHDKLESILSTITNMQNEVIKSPAFQGGNWEFNLRDVERWLDLIKRYPTLDPGCHFQTVIEHRFRTADQKTAIESLKANQPPEITRSLYHNISSSSYQVGIASLARDVDFQTVKTNIRQLPVHLLPYAKSAILALNGGWPIILSGSSGCGKTMLIRHLAALSGARLVELSLNSDIDTIDLIGGFEQYDAERELAEIKSSIKDACEDQIKNNSLFTRVECADILNLRALCISERSLPVELVASIYSLSDETAAWHEKNLQRLLKIEQEATNQRLRFVWHDGILVDALQNGSWMVLDNANYCNASVLDRLNSVLEPDGSLIISEHHTSGGAPRLIKPHPNFRVFLTMDPRFGELSRAMRNRSLEIYIPSNEDGEARSAEPGYACASDISRLRLLDLAIDEDSTFQLGNTDIVIQYLSHIDLTKLDAETLQLLNPNHLSSTGHTELDPGLASLLIGNGYKIATSRHHKEHEFAFHAIIDAVNEPALAISTAFIGVEEAKFIYTQRNLKVQMVAIQSRARMASMVSGTEKHSDLSVLQQSASGRRARRRGVEKIPEIINFLFDFCNILAREVAVTQFRGSVVHILEITDAFSPLLTLMHELIVFFSSKKFDEARFQAYLQFANTRVREMKPRSLPLEKELLGVLKGFGKGFDLQSGSSLQRLWNTWRPKTPSSQEQMESLLIYAQLVTRFRKIALNFGGSTKFLAAIQSKLFDVRFLILEQTAGTHQYLGEVANVLTALEEQNKDRVSNPRLLAPVFETVSQAVDFGSEGRDVPDQDLLALLARRSMSERRLLAVEGSVPHLLTTLSTLSSFKQNQPHLDVMREDTGQMILQKLALLEDQPLQALNYAKEEISTLMNSICNNSDLLEPRRVEQVNNSVKNLVGLMISSHADLINPKVEKTWRSIDEFLAEIKKLWDSKELINDPKGTGQEFHRALSEYLIPALSSLYETPISDSLRTGLGLTNFSLAALRLFVPDQPFDPALAADVTRDNHVHRSSELRTKIEAMRTFQLRFTGQSTSLILRLVEKELEQLGEEPAVSGVLRPAVSNLLELSYVFSTTVDFFLDPERWVQLQDTPGNLEKKNLSTDYTFASWGTGCTTLISEMIRRLGEFDGTYDDICKPVIWILKCLHLGLELIMSSGSHNSPRNKWFQQICQFTPLLGGTPAAVQAWKFPKISDLIAPFDLRHQWLLHLSLRSQILENEGKENSTLATSMRDFLVVMDTYYREWKSRLRKGQKAMEQKSKYYEYRGKDEDNDSNDLADQMRMFPTFDDEMDSFTGPRRNSDSDARATTLKVAELHGRIFPGFDDDPLRTYLESGLQALSRPDDKKGDTSSAISLFELLPAAVLEMDKKIKALQAESGKAKINIYTDRSITEICKLHQLSVDIEDRFRQIAQIWPEHAVPAEVMQSCRDIMQLKLNEPIAKLLVRAEKLFETVARWEAVASREYSVTSLQTQISDLIISWRRMELSSWSKLLDLETTKYEEDARGWYFMLYEAILVNPRSIMDNDGDIAAYNEELVGTLEEFLNSTTRGQLSPRLRLLHIFRQSLQVLCRLDNRFQSIDASVHSVMAHFKRYQASANAALVADRSKLEKAVQDQIKMATWRDSNPISLKDSARRSHNKLFRIVRKYRTALEKPAGPFQPLSAAKIKDYIPPVLALAPSSSKSEALRSALAHCEAVISDWKSRPDRLTNTTGAADTIARFYRNQRSDFAPEDHLVAFHRDLLSSISDLRSQTPSALTDENQSLVTNLKEQKKRLLADTFKVLSKMGVKRNLASNELEAQSSMARILSRSPDLNTTDAAWEADAAFHDFLDLIVKARASLAEHSDDLTASEVRRGLGLLEGMLSISIKQRNAISLSWTGIHAIQKHMSLLENLESRPLDACVLDKADLKSRVGLMADRFSWLVEMLGLAISVLEIHSHHTSIPKQEIIDKLTSRKKEFRDMIVDLTMRRPLPTGLCQGDEDDLLVQGLQKLNELEIELQNYIVASPNAKYILVQLMPWTETHSLSSTITTNGTHQCSLEDFDGNLRQLLDQVFVAVQQLRRHSSDTSQSTEDHEWLTKSDARFRQAAKSLHAAQIAQGIQNVLSQVPNLHQKDTCTAISLIISARPVLDQYHKICDHNVDGSILLHLNFTQLAVSLARSFITITTEGYCSPTENSQEQDTSGKLEAGTGLGDGEGAEDISKDVGDEEDLSEFAQAENAKKEEGNAEASKDAVDMGPDELNGDTEGFHDVSENEDDDAASEGERESGDEVDEEVGSVDDLDPAAVDEKMWDDAKQDAEKELKGDKAKGKKSEDQTAADKIQGDEGDAGSDNGEEDNGLDGEEDEDDVEMGAERAEAENLDPHVDNEQVMELPDDLQLNGEEKAVDDMSDGGMDELSDIEDSKMDNEGAEGDEEVVDGEGSDHEVDGSQAGSEDQEAGGNELDDDVVENGDEGNEDDILHTADNEMQYEHDQQQGSEAATTGGPQGQDKEPNEESHARAQQSQQQRGRGVAEQATEPAEGDEQSTEKQAGQGDNEKMERLESETLKKLADVVERWHQRQDIMPASDLKPEEQQESKDIEMQDAEFEHLADEEDEGDAQAAGVAAQDQTQNLQEGAMVENKDKADLPESVLRDIEEDDAEEATIEEQLSRLQTDAGPIDSHGGAFIPKQQERQIPQGEADNADLDEDLPDEPGTPDETKSVIADQLLPNSLSPETAAKLWSHYSTSTHQFSLILTEQLRLILAPTLATKLRGDFRTGKRLNIKRIIPYIASQYKRDKIWMRRSVPSKRNYQIMIAVDDSKSMMEGGTGGLALETVAMLCKSLSMLEVGEICVVAFGNEEKVRIAHPFGQPFSADVGASVFQAFSFAQTATNVRKLVAESINLFQDARARSAASQADLWQLQLIISDGICEDHDAIQRLVRQAKEDKIMIVFVIVDSVSGSSIMDLTSASFEPDVVAGGEMKLKMRRYLEKFPFPYYLVVRDVRDLPGVLATALKGWFAQVVDVQ